MENAVWLVWTGTIKSRRLKFHQHFPAQRVGGAGALGNLVSDVNSCSSLVNKGSSKLQKLKANFAFDSENRGSASSVGQASCQMSFNESHPLGSNNGNNWYLQFPVCKQLIAKSILDIYEDVQGPRETREVFLFVAALDTRPGTLCFSHSSLCLAQIHEARTD